MGNTSGNEKPKAGSGLFLGGVICMIAASVILLGPDSWQVGALYVVRRALWFGGIALVSSGIVRMQQARSSRQDSVPASQKGVQEAAPQSPHASVEALIQRSDDVASALKDLVAHGQGAADYGMLPALLVRSGLMGWEDAPKFTASRLRRNRRWWISADVDGLTEQGYGHLVALEGALNVAADLVERDWPAGLAPEVRLSEVFSGLADLEPLGTVSTSQELGTSGEKDGEWEARLSLSDFLENLPAPFRVVTAFTMSLDEGLACVDVVVPSPGCLALVAPDDAALQAEEARAYAFRLALLVARGALAASSRIAQVGVNCICRTSSKTLFSLLVGREDLGALRREARKPQPEPPVGERCRMQVRADGWLDPVEPLLARSDARLNQAGRWEAIELVPGEATPAIAAACGAHELRDLGINENALRVTLWNGLLPNLGTTTQEAVSHLMALKASSDDASVSTACDRVCQALVEGTADVSDRRALASLFVDGSPLSRARQRAHDLLEGDPTPDDLAQALSALDAVLVPLAQAGTYADTDTRAFRFFNSAAERVRFNKTQADGRQVVLVPDEYCAAHSCAARILTMLERPEEAMVHLDELSRIAPMTPDAALARVRALEAQERIFECVETLCAAIGYAATARDASICLYRLAYMEWRLGRTDLAIACYQRSMQLHGEIAGQAKEELQELLSREDGTTALEADQVIPVLEAAGIPTWDPDQIRRDMAAAAIACTDAGLFGIARGYLAVALETNRDDALLGVYRSLAEVRPEG